MENKNTHTSELELGVVGFVCVCVHSSAIVSEHKQAGLLSVLVFVKFDIGSQIV